MWVVRVSIRELHRYLKCCWELEQPRLVAPWIVSGVVLAATEAHALCLLEDGEDWKRGVEGRRGG